MTQPLNFILKYEEERLIMTDRSKNCENVYAL